MTFIPPIIIPRGKKSDGPPACKRLLVILLSGFLLPVAQARPSVAANKTKTVSAPSLPASTNPKTGPGVMISAVTDRRLCYDQHGTINPRLVGRNSRAYFVDPCDLVLPQGHAVTDLVEQTVTRGLRDGGYRVLAAGDPDFAKEAIALQVSIERLWIEQTREWEWQFRKDTHCIARIAVTGLIELFLDGEIYETQISTKGSATKAICKCLNELAEVIGQSIRSGEEGEPTNAVGILP